MGGISIRRFFAILFQQIIDLIRVESIGRESGVFEPAEFRQSAGDVAGAAVDVVRGVFWDHVFEMCETEVWV